MDNSCGSPAHGASQMRIMGSVTVFFTIISISIDAAVSHYVTYPTVLGGWREGLVVLACALLALSSSSRGIVVAICILSIIAVILELVASINDGAYASIAKAVQTCATSLTTYTGSGDYSLDAVQCWQYYDSNANAYQTYDCMCVVGQVGSNITDCFPFNIQSNNCNDVPGKYASILGAAAAFDVFSLLSIFVVSVLSCCSLCCPGNFGPLEAQNNVQMEDNQIQHNINGVPTVVIVSGQAGQAVPAMAQIVPPSVTQAYATDYPTVTAVTPAGGTSASGGGTKF